MNLSAQVQKRNGTVVPYDLSRITSAIMKALAATEEIPYDRMHLTASRAAVLTEQALLDKYQGTPEFTTSVEEIQDLVEQTLMALDLPKTAKAYILYRKQHEKLRHARTETDFIKKIVEDYIGPEKDWRVKENSTVSVSLGGLILSNSGAITANYWLNEIYDEDIKKAHSDGDMHIHDLSMLSGYCAGWSLKQLIQVGIGGVEGRITSAPASHLSTLCNQMVNFLGIMQNEWAGAQAFSSFDTYLAPFVRKDNLTYKEVKQCIQSFVYGVNTPSRWGTQAPFTNITLDWVCPDDMKNMPAIVGGKEQDFTYGDCVKEMAMVNKAFIEIMIEGDANGRGFQYPIPTYSITRDFDWSPSENNKLLFEMTAKYGTPYFSNYINSDMEPSDVRAMCPLRGDQKVLVMDDYSKEFHISTIENLYGGSKKDKVYTILLNGETKLARLHRFDGLDFYKVRTVNGHEVIFSGNHQNLALKKDSTEGAKVKPTTELTTSDYLPFSIEPFDGGKGLSYDDGYLVGAFMGDGSLRDDYAVIYSLNDTTKNEVMSKIIDIGVDRYGAKVTTTNANKTGTCINVTLISKSLRGLIEDYVTGKAIDKALNPKCINRSLEFRKGILDGLLATDGNIKSNRIYTSSKLAVETITTMLASMGIPTNVRSDNRDSTETMSDNPVYCIRAYRPATCQPSYGDVYVRQDGYMWFRIESIEPITGGSAIGYCFEVLNDEEPYFMLPSGLVTHNCRLRLDLRELRKKSGGYFGAGESTGSVGVVTLNLPRLAYLSTNETEFYQRLSRLMDIAARSLNIKRRVITKLMEEGLYPYTKAYLGSFDNHFSTIGLVGMNEACLNAKWIHTTIAEPAGHQFAEEVLDFMRNRLSDYQEQYQGTLFNLEATPAESTAYRLAKHDIVKYPDIITAAAPDQTAYYTNSSQLPVGYTDDIFDALDLQDNLQVKYTSGTVFHAFLGERLPNWQAAANLVRKIAENYKLPYYTLSPTYAICAEHGYLPGEQYKCPFCGKETEVYSRITGYYRPLKNWNDGKVQEFKNRLEYDQHKAGVPDTEPTPCEAMCASCQVEIPADSSEQVPESVAAEMPILVATETCPNCRMAARFLDDAGIAFTKVYASQRPDLVETYGIRTAPTLLVPDHGQMKAIINASNIRAYAEANKNQ